MQSLGIREDFSAEIEEIMREAGLGGHFKATVKVCTDINQVFKALAEDGARHFAILTRSSTPISDSFRYIKERLSEDGRVSLALFFEKETVH